MVSCEEQGKVICKRLFVAHSNMKLYKMNVKSTFLNGLIQEEVYVEQPLGYESDTLPHHVFKLNQTLYGLKQAPRAWYENLSSFLLENGFKQGKVDTTSFHKNYDFQFILVQVYVDDIIFGANNEMLHEEFSKLMQTKFEMSMVGKLMFFLELQIKKTSNGIYIHQTKYVKELIEKFNMDDANEMKIPMHPTLYLRLDEESIKLDKNQYRAMIGSLLQLTTPTPNIMFSVCLCARFQKEPREVHLSVVKHIFRYLIGTFNLGLWFKRREDFKLTSYCDANYAGDKLERKSTSGSCHSIGGNLLT